MTPDRAAASALATDYVEHRKPIAASGPSADAYTLAHEYQELERECEQLRLDDGVTAHYMERATLAEEQVTRLREVAKAAARWEADLSSDCDTADRTALRAALAALHPGDCDKCSAYEARHGE